MKWKWWTKSEPRRVVSAVNRVALCKALRECDGVMRENEWSTTNVTSQRISFQPAGARHWGAGGCWSLDKTSVDRTTGRKWDLWNRKDMKAFLELVLAYTSYVCWWRLLRVRCVLKVKFRQTKEMWAVDRSQS